MYYGCPWGTPEKKTQKRFFTEVFKKVIIFKSVLWTHLIVSTKKRYLAEKRFIREPTVITRKLWNRKTAYRINFEKFNEHDKQKL